MLGAAHLSLVSPNAELNGLPLSTKKLLFFILQLCPKNLLLSSVCLQQVASLKLLAFLPGLLKLDILPSLQLVNG